MPCASLLVRIRLAPMTEDNSRPLSLNDKMQKEWEQYGIWIKP